MGLNETISERRGGALYKY